MVEGLSKYKKEVMGLAMILVVLTHTTFEFEKGSLAYIIKGLGDIGVDIFLLMGGIGVYFSKKKYKNNKMFFLAKFKRVIPKYLIVAIIWYPLLYVLVEKNLGYTYIDVILNITTLSFWIKGNLSSWFIVGILFCYGIGAFYIDKFQGKIKKSVKRDSILIVIICLVIKFSFLNNILGHILILIVRIPIFLIGIYFGEVIYNKEKIEGVRYINIISIILLAYIFLTGNIDKVLIKYILYIPISISISLLLTKILSFSYTSMFKKILGFIGIYTLEIYIFHEKLLIVSTSIGEKFFQSCFISNVLAIVGAIICSILMKMIFDFAKTLKKNTKYNEVKKR